MTPEERFESLRKAIDTADKAELYKLKAATMEVLQIFHAILWDTHMRIKKLEMN